MAIAYGGRVATANLSGTSSTIIADSDLTVPVGSLVVVTIPNSNVSWDLTAMADSAGNTYTLDADPPDASTNNRLRIAWTITEALITPDATFTATLSTGVSLRFMTVDYFTGVVGPPDAADYSAAFLSGSSLTYGPTDATPATAGYLALCVAEFQMAASATATDLNLASSDPDWDIASVFVPATSSGNRGCALIYKVGAVAAAETFTGTKGNGLGHIARILVFPAAGTDILLDAPAAAATAAGQVPTVTTSTAGPALKQQASNYTPGAANVTATLGVAATAGNVLLAVVMSNQNGGATALTAPSGFTLLKEYAGASGNPPRMAIYGKTAAGGETAVQAAHTGGSFSMVCWVGEFENVSLTAIADSQASLNAAETTALDSGAITVGVSEALVLAAIGQEDIGVQTEGADGYLTATVNNDPSATASRQRSKLGVYYRFTTSAGTFQETPTSTASRQFTGIQVALPLLGGDIEIVAPAAAATAAGPTPSIATSVAGPTLEQANSGYNPSGLTLTVNLPVPATAGRLLIGIVQSNQNGGATTLADIPGWTLVKEYAGSSGAPPRLGMYAKVATGGETGITFTHSANLRLMGWIGEVSGLVNPMLLDGTPGQASSNAAETNQLDSGSITTAGGQSFVIAAVGQESNNAFTESGTPQAFTVAPFPGGYEAGTSRNLNHLGVFYTVGDANTYREQPSSAGSFQYTGIIAAFSSGASSPAPVDTVTIDTTQIIGVSKLQTAALLAQHTLEYRSGSAAAAVAKAERLTATVATHVANHLMRDFSMVDITSGGTTDNGSRNWSSGSRNMDDVNTTWTRLRALNPALRPVLICYAAPNYTHEGNTGTNIPPDDDPTDALEYAQLVVQALQRYPLIRDISVWNEYKGFGTRNAAAHARYARMYNAIWDAVKAYDPTIRVGGPHLAFGGTTNATQRSNPPVSWSYDSDTFVHWLQNCANVRGCDMVTVDYSLVNHGGDGSEGNLALIASWSKRWKVITENVRTWINTYAPNLPDDVPIWWIEYYFDVQGHRSGWYPRDFGGLMQTTMLGNLMLGGSAAVFLWQIEGDYQTGWEEEGMMYGHAWFKSTHPDTRTVTTASSVAPGATTIPLTAIPHGDMPDEGYAWVSSQATSIHYTGGTLGTTLTGVTGVTNTIPAGTQLKLGGSGAIAAGDAFPPWHSAKAFKDYFPPGKQLVFATTNRDYLEVFAQPTHAIVANARAAPSAFKVRVNNGVTELNVSLAGWGWAVYSLSAAPGTNIDIFAPAGSALAQGGVPTTIALSSQMAAPAAAAVASGPTPLIHIGMPSTAIPGASTVNPLGPLLPGDDVLAGTEQMARGTVSGGWRPPSRSNG